MNRQHLRKNAGRQQNESVRIVFTYVLLCCAFFSTGCKQQQSTPLFVITRQDALHVERNPRISTSDVMEIAGDVLTDMHFTIEKADVQSGFIRTRPLPGAQFFEFWRGDNVGTDNTLAANLHTIRRTVTLDISQVGAVREPPLRIDCEVQAQRLSLPERQVNSSARVYGMFSLSSPSLQRLQINPEQEKEMAWIDLGRDSRLEAEILKRIETQIVRQTNRLLQTTENQI